MSRGVSWVVGGSVILVALAGCGRSFLSYEQRAPWRKEAELACLNSGTVREGAGVVRISPIDGPGMCGAEFPLKISMLGESSAMGYLDESLRPPGAIPGAAPAAQPRWPVAQQPYDAPQPRYAPLPETLSAPTSQRAAPRGSAPTLTPPTLTPPGATARAAAPTPASSVTAR